MSRLVPQPLAAMPAAARRGIHTVLTDIDDTLSTHGRVTAEAYAALQRLRDAGRRVIPITGRPAGWCDLIARMWPVDAIVGENGALYMIYDAAARKLRRRFVTSEVQRRANRLRLDAVAAKIIRDVPGCALASDQHYRETDVAIDYCEDVAPLSYATAERIADLMRVEGLTAKVSSIHVNGWVGSYDKLAMTRTLLADEFGIDLGSESERGRIAFLGDSPNDAPMFGFFPYSIGVANVRVFGDRIADPPKFVTASAAGAGFVEAVDLLIAG
jgi:HAD superfamily hydrolase (TIGR01484 family)